MNREEQLAWEARWGRPAGVATLLSAVLFLVSLFALVPKQRDGIESYPNDLLTIDGNPSGFLVSMGASAIATLLLIAAFLYLFRGILARGGGIPRWFVYILVIGPVLAAIGTVLNAIDLRDVADEFASGGVVRGEAGTDRAEDLTDKSPVIPGLQLAGLFAIAFSFVMLSLRGRQVGLLSSFMGVLGVIVGVIPFLDFLQVGPVVRVFWLGALGMLFLDKWPRGRGPAWESGEAELWPTAAQRRGLAPMPGEEPQLDPHVPPEPEPVPERPASRKRRGKRR